MPAVRHNTLHALSRTASWPLAHMHEQHDIKKTMNCSTRYPIKLFRYWFMDHLIREHAADSRQPVSICEIGVDRGQLPTYVRTAGPIPHARWDAVDCRFQPETSAAGYSDKILANVDRPDFDLPCSYDLIVTLHLLEHLYDPEALVTKLADKLSPGGMLIGGFPVTPGVFAGWWQRRLRSKKSGRAEGDNGHVSVFSPQRVKQMATNAGLELSFISGTFFLRKTNAFVENSSLWIRANLAWGAMFPSLGGEIYWAMKKGRPRAISYRERNADSRPSRMYARKIPA